MEDLLRCSICLDIFNRPKRLGCNHIFCAHCLVSWYERTEEEASSISCPECRHETPISARPARAALDVNGDQTSPIDDLPNDRTIQQLLDLRQAEEAAQEVTRRRVQCHNCESVFTNQCQHCSKHLCQECGSDHLQKEMTKKLNVIQRNLTEISSTEDFREKLRMKMRFSIQAAREKAINHLNFHFDQVVTTLYNYLENPATFPDITETKVTVQAGQELMATKEATFLDLNLLMNQCESSLVQLEGLEKTMDKLYDELLSFQWSVNKMAVGVRERLDDEFSMIKEEVKPEAPRSPRKASSRIRYNPVVPPLKGEDTDVKMQRDELTTRNADPSRKILTLMRELLVESNEEIRWEDYRFRKERPWVAIPAPSTDPSTSGQQSQDEPKAPLVRTSLHTKTGLFKTPTLRFIPDGDFKRRTNAVLNMQDEVTPPRVPNTQDQATQPRVPNTREVTQPGVPNAQGEVIQSRVPNTQGEVIQPRVPNTQGEVIQPRVPNTQDEVIQPRVPNTQGEVIQSRVPNTQDEVIQPRVPNTQDQATQPRVPNTQDQATQPRVPNKREVTQPGVPNTQEVIPPRVPNTTGRVIPRRVPDTPGSESCIIPPPRLTDPEHIPELDLEGRSTVEQEWIISKLAEIHQADTIMADTSSYSYEEIRWADSESRSLRAIFAMLAEIDGRNQTEQGDDVTYVTPPNPAYANEHVDQPLQDPRSPTYVPEPASHSEENYYDDAEAYYYQLEDGSYVMVPRDVVEAYQQQQQQPQS